MSKPYIIAEIGSNWKMSPDTTPDQDLHNAIRCVRYAHGVNADAVKFQLFDYETLYGVEGETDFAFDPEWLPHLDTVCHELGIDLMVTAFDCDGVSEINPYVKLHKIASSSLSNSDLLDTIGIIGKPFLYSLGMTDYEFPDDDNAIPLACASLYPAQPEDYDLSKIGKWMKHDWGLSDHTKCSTLAKICRAHGAKYFEKHFNPLYNDYSPDAFVSVGIHKFKTYVNDIHSTQLGRPFRVRTNAHTLYADKFSEKLGRFARPEPLKGN